MSRKILNKKAMALGMVAVLAASSSLSGDVAQAAVKNLNKASVTKSITVGVGCKRNITVSKVPTKTVKSFTSSNKKVVKVTKTGKVTGVKVGTATIKVKLTYNKKTVTKTCKITVKKAVTKVNLKKKSVNLVVGKKYTISKTTVTPKSALAKFTYSSSDKKIATVTSKGVVTAKKVGKAKITVKAADGSGKKATLTVNVVSATEATQKPVVSDAPSKDKVISAADIVNGIATVTGEYDSITVDSSVGTATVNIDKANIKKLVMRDGAGYTVKADASTIGEVKTESSVKAAALKKMDAANSPKLELGSSAKVDVITVTITMEIKGEATANVGKVAVEAPVEVSITVPVAAVLLAPTATNANVSIASKVASIVVEAVGAALKLTNAEIKSVEVKAANASVKVEGTSKVEKVEVAKEATKTKVEVAKEAKIDNAEIKGEGTSVEGSGTVSKIAVEANDTVVKGVETEVTVAKDVTGTTVNDKTVAGGTEQKIDAQPDTGSTTPADNPTPVDAGNTGYVPSGNGGSTSTVSYVSTGAKDFKYIDGEESKEFKFVAVRNNGTINTYSVTVEQLKNYNNTAIAYTKDGKSSSFDVSGMIKSGNTYTATVDGMIVTVAAGTGTTGTVTVQGVATTFAKLFFVEDCKKTTVSSSEATKENLKQCGVTLTCFGSSVTAYTVSYDTLKAAATTLSKVNDTATVACTKQVGEGEKTDASLAAKKISDTVIEITDEAIDVVLYVSATESQSTATSVAFDVVALTWDENVSVPKIAIDVTPNKN